MHLSRGILVLSVMCWSVVAHSQGHYTWTTGFDVFDVQNSYFVGDLPSQDFISWWSLAGTATVQTTTVRDGFQSVELSEGSVLRYSNSITGQFVWADMHLHLAPSTAAPVIPTNPCSAVISFATNGIFALDGTGSGTGTWVIVTNSVPRGRYFRLTTRLDFDGSYQYDVWLDGKVAREGLGFKDNAARLFNVYRRSSRKSYLDRFTISTAGLYADSDGDGRKDLDEAIHGYNPNSSPGSAAGEPSDFIERLTAMFAGYRFDSTVAPTNGRTFIELADVETSPLLVTLRFPTMAGFQYSIERTDNLVSNVWAAVGGTAPFSGNDTVQEFSYVPTGSAEFVHIRSEPDVILPDPPDGSPSVIVDASWTLDLD